MSTYNDTTLNNLSQEFFYSFFNEHSLSSTSRRSLPALCILAVGANQKNFVVSVSGRSLALYSGLSYQNNDIAMKEMCEVGIITKIHEGNGITAPTYAFNDELVKIMSLLKLELQSMFKSKNNNSSILNSYSGLLFTTWEKSWILSPVLATNHGLARVCAVMGVKGLTGASAIAKEIGVSARAVRRSLTLLSNMGITDGGKIERVKEFVYTYFGLEDYLDTGECEEIIKKNESRLKRYKKQIMIRMVEAVHIIKFGALSPVSKTKALKDLRFSASWDYKLKDGIVTYKDKRTGLVLHTLDVYKGIKKYDMSTARYSVDQAKRFDLSICEIA